MFHFQTLDCYRCAASFLPLAYALAKLGDGELGTQLRRAALSISLNIAEGTGRIVQRHSMLSWCSVSQMRESRRVMPFSCEWFRRSRK